MTTSNESYIREKIQTYLTQVAQRLEAAGSKDVLDIVDDLRDHIERELAELKTPVTEADLQRIFERLGEPERVVTEDEIPSWKKAVFSLRHGPEDWRLAYLSLGVFIVGTMLTGPLGLIGSFVLARAALALNDQVATPAKKWLLYPSLILVYSLIILLVTLVPALAAGAVGIGIFGTRHGTFYKQPFFDGDGLGTVLSVISVGLFGVSSVGTLFWMWSCKQAHLLVNLFRPFAAVGATRRLGFITLAFWGVTLLMAGAAYVLWTWGNIWVGVK